MKLEKEEEKNGESAPFCIRTYSKVELSMLYNPTSCLSNAINLLATWIRMNFPLCEELAAVGYNKYRRNFTPKEVSLIVKYLGEP